MEEKNNTLYIDDASTTYLAEKYGTPLYVYSVSEIKDRIGELKKDFLNKYENTTVSYASKAFLTKAMAKLISDEGINLDVVSGGELYIALSAKFPPERIEFNGNNKLYDEIELAVKNNVGKIIIDGASELPMIEEAAKKYNKKVNVLYRVTPGIDAHTHEYISTGKLDSKFGFPIDEVIGEVKKANASEYVNFIGYHFHIGSQLFENDIYLKALDIVFKLIEDTISEIGENIQELNIGGGFGITYTDEKRPPFSFFLEPIMNKINTYFNSKNLKRPIITIEPGRSVVGEAGYTLYTVGSIKNVEGIRKYVAIDGGMTDNIRPALYDAKYRAIVANNVNGSNLETVTICGKCCESGDIIITDAEIPATNTGDLICIPSTGAYGYSMSSNYNSLLKPAIVFVEKGKDTLVLKRQTYKDLVRNDVV
ncbi:diaminopimelate decarboxylase [Anaerosphaera aminiphila DSM 21120]|uniref:Diaminopimelate decarboxylase n=1 Tax=Anaerosphaera aminiphila DSM 21120 TaxID=1120995 RepID=A0A1M5TC84_9FIRM|nr:diaminopimelate decarboxylase [Anaerosphaera aminiphila]SHH48314.1 diaminopimelate decarboxylase [Anaerosphaera aminiphila DSM 21120]